MARRIPGHGVSRDALVPSSSGQRCSLVHPSLATRDERKAPPGTRASAAPLADTRAHWSYIPRVSHAYPTRIPRISHARLPVCPLAPTDTGPLPCCVGASWRPPAGACRPPVAVGRGEAYLVPVGRGRVQGSRCVPPSCRVCGEGAGRSEGVHHKGAHRQ